MSAGNHCPLLNKKCIEHKCAWYAHVLGKNPQTGADVTEYSCVVGLIPMLLIENSAQQRSTGAAVESFRNETVKRNDTLNQLLAHTATQTANLLNYSVPPEIKIIEPGQEDED